MSNLTHAIEKYICDLLDAGEEPSVSLRRKELADFFGCVPSQINYVLRSRFTPEHGFLIESRRGGQGYIRILRIACETKEERLQHIDDLIGDVITEKECHRLLQLFQERGLLTGRERLLIEVTLRHADEMGRDDFDLSQHKRNKIQAKMLKRMLQSLMLD